MQKIENGAFANLENFAKVEVSANSKLAYVGENAFSGTSMLKESSGNYNPDYKAIVIGKVYYRFIDKSATDTRILSDVKTHRTARIRRLRKPQIHKPCGMQTSYGG